MLNKLTILAILLGSSAIMFGQETKPAPSPTPETAPSSYRQVVPGEETKLTAVPASGSIQKPISGGVLNGKAIVLPKPVYPAAALAVRSSGTVEVQVLIDEAGKVVSAEAVSGPPLLRGAAVAAARGASFAPTRLSGQLVKVSGIITYNFVDDTPLAAPAGGGIIPPEDKDSAWIIGAVMSIIRSDDPEMMEAMTDGKGPLKFLTELGSDLPVELKDDKQWFDALANASPGERPVAAIKLFEAIKAHLTEEQKWQAEVGVHVGNLMIEMKRVLRSGASDASKLNSYLQSIRLLVKPPAETSPELVTKFKNIGAFADSPDLLSRPKIAALWKTVEILINSIPE
jgi:TonB family protein